MSICDPRLGGPGASTYSDQLCLFISLFLSLFFSRALTLSLLSCSEPNAPLITDFQLLESNERLQHSFVALFVVAQCALELSAHANRLAF